MRQTNLSFSYPGVVRAWHRHSRGQIDYFCVLQGALRICAYDPETKALAEVVATEHKRVVVRIPGHYYHGSMALGSSPSLLLYFTSALYDYEKPDEERIPWNDQSICPAEINGRKDDPRADQPWDWLRHVHR
jgi:dTDP-4-dehydrorhamnose 3,5-epimerase